MPRSSFELKGSSFTLSVLHLKTSNLEQIKSELVAKIALAPHFFIGAPLVLNLSQIVETEFNIGDLKQMLAEMDLVIVGITEASNTLIEQAKSVGLASIKTGKTVNTPTIPKTTKVIKKTVRSGQQVYAKNADLIIIGSVSNGAEVIADGSIHIHGTIRGKAMAGAAGDKHSVVIAHNLQAELISIAGQYWLNDKIQEQLEQPANCIRLEQENLILEPLPF
ncbi:septum site-determining protein MinC [Shewanella sp. OPT22]|nr:septum site-determining protein MinC [Shewanella sp. OPT22]